jgi:hypothetical protein
MRRGALEGYLGFAAYLAAMFEAGLPIAEHRELNAWCAHARGTTL